MKPASHPILTPWSGGLDGLPGRAELGVIAGGLVPVPGWFTWESHDCGVAVADINRDGRSEVVVMMVDNPSGQNSGRYGVGRTFAADGMAAAWGPWIPIPD